MGHPRISSGQEPCPTDEARLCPATLGQVLLASERASREFPSCLSG